MQLWHRPGISFYSMPDTLHVQQSLRAKPVPTQLLYNTHLLENGGDPFVSCCELRPRSGIYPALSDHKARSQPILWLAAGPFSGASALPDHQRPSLAMLSTLDALKDVVVSLAAGQLVGAFAEHCRSKVMAVTTGPNLAKSFPKPDVVGQSCVLCVIRDEAVD